MKQNRKWESRPWPMEGCLASTLHLSGPVRVIVSWDGPDGDKRWHMSVSRKDRYPSWDEIADARYDLLPNELNMAMFLPAKEKYLNYMEFCLHLWEIKDPWLPLDEGIMKPRTHEDGTIAAETDESFDGSPDDRTPSLESQRRDALRR